LPILAPMDVRSVPVRDLSGRDLDAWHDLAGRAAEPNPFFEPEFLLPAAAHLSGGDDVSLLVATEDGDWTACLPVRSERLGGVVPAVASWRHVYCFLGTPLVDSSRLDQALESLLGHVAASPRSPMLVINRLGTGGPVADALTRVQLSNGLASMVHLPFERAILRRRAEATYTHHMRPHHRRELKRLSRRLGEELGVSLRVLDRSGELSAVDDFLALEAAGWKGHSNTAIGSDPAHRGFFAEVCARFGELGRLQLLALEADGRTLAMKCNLIAAPGSFAFKIAYDEELRRFSPGVQLERATIDVFHEEREEEWLDSCAAPDNEMINRLWPDRRGILTALISKRGVRSVVSRSGLRAAHALRAREEAAHH
jgi:CelD/BcsL family acetyltransferase involved in cellulose biosynthesis